MNLYSVKSLYVWEVEKQKTLKNVQERVVLIWAKSPEAAIEKAEKEAAKFCKNSYENIHHKKVTIRVLEYFDVYEIEGDLKNGAEVFNTSTLITKAMKDKILLKKAVDLDQSISAKESEKLHDHFRACDHDHDHHH